MQWLLTVWTVEEKDKNKRWEGAGCVMHGIAAKKNVADVAWAPVDIDVCVYMYVHMHIHCGSYKDYYFTFNYLHFRYNS